jgi:hypothetical protein
MKNEGVKTMRRFRPFIIRKLKSDAFTIVVGSSFFHSSSFFFVFVSLELFKLTRNPLPSQPQLQVEILPTAEYSVVRKEMGLKGCLLKNGAHHDQGRIKNITYPHQCYLKQEIQQKGYVYVDQILLRVKA